MMQMLGQMMWLPVSMLTGWMNLLAMAMRGMQPPGGHGAERAIWAGNAPGTGFPGAGTYIDNQWAQGDGATKPGKEERKMSDCCCDHDHHHEVKLVEYTIVSIKRCDERIITKGEIIYSDDMSDESFATWVVALYLNENPNSIPHDEKRYLRVYHHVLESWPRPEKDCCDDRQIDVLRGIEKAIRDLTGTRREEAAVS
ncbi:MAG TPA: hypothetical protein VF756_13035 [Thermoanaerobaculia bacterium]